MLPLCTDVQAGPHTSKTQVLRPNHHAAGGQPTGQLMGYSDIWRPWILTIKDTGLKKPETGAMTSVSRQSKDALGFQHPVRLFLPKSRIQEYLSHLGKKVLASFPVQATLHFYNDDSSSEDSEDAEETTGRERAEPLSRVPRGLGSGS